MSVVRPFSRALRLAPAVAALGLVAVPLLAGAPAEAAVAKPVDVVRVRYDLPGRDPNANTGYNQEYVELKNTGTRTVDLSGYTVSDNGAKHRYAAPRGTLLAPGRTILLRSGTGRNGGGSVYWGRPGYVWNNTGDAVTLRTASGQLLEKCSYSSRDRGTKTC